ncbi:MAG: alkaline phosphatase [Candidatus Aminicenantes bacterium]|jgi:alkaline phosphatase
MESIIRKKKPRQEVLSLMILVKTLTFIVVAGLMAGGCATEPPGEKSERNVNNSTVKNVIMLVYDGQGTGAITCTRWYKGQALAMDEMAAGLCSTYMGDSIITDSAPAATAFATGHKSNLDHISVLPTTAVIVPGVRVPPEEKKGMPVASLLEGAKQMGKSTGIIATSFIQHSTPACFSAHISNSSNFEVIAEQQVYMGIDVVLSGGSKFLQPTAHGGFREDGEDLIKVLKENHYEYITTRDQLLNANAEKIWGMFAPVDMAFDLDRQQLHPEQPSLAEMTQKAIEVLSRNPNGFFLFVESSKTDWAAHANDPIGVISDMLALDDAVAVALNFARRNRDTLILLFPDHDTGGMTIGSKESDKNHDAISKEMVIAPLKRVKLTSMAVQKILATDTDPSPERIREVLLNYYGIDDLSDEEVRDIANCTGKCLLIEILGPIISKRAYIGWTSTGHTGNDVPFHSYGPNRPTGHFDNTDIAKICAQRLGFNLEDVSAKLFIDSQKAFTSLGAHVHIDETDVKNPVLVAKKGSVTVHIPFHKNKLKINTTEYRMPGIAVFVPKTGQIFIPKSSIELVKKEFKQVR